MKRGFFLWALFLACDVPSNDQQFRDTSQSCTPPFGWGDCGAACETNADCDNDLVCVDNAEGVGHCLLTPSAACPHLCDVQKCDTSAECIPGQFCNGENACVFASPPDQC